MTTNLASDSPQGSRVRRLRAILLPISLLALVLGLTPAARADLVYTWHETDGQPVTGSLDVSPQALTFGSISTSDVVSFSFKDFGNSHTGLFPFSPIPIDSQGIPTTNTALIDSTGNLFVEFDRVSFDPIKQGIWVDSAGNSAGKGYWTVVNTSPVPEPSSLALCFLGALSGIAYVQGRKRWALRRRGAVSQS
jgi:hypothetical protein